MKFRKRLGPHVTVSQPGNAQVKKKSSEDQKTLVIPKKSFQWQPFLSGHIRNIESSRTMVRNNVNNSHSEPAASS